MKTIATAAAAADPVPDRSPAVTVDVQVPISRQSSSAAQDDNGSVADEDQIKLAVSDVPSSQAKNN